MTRASISRITPACNRSEGRRRGPAGRYALSEKPRAFDVRLLRHSK
ncbi:hypothetical protein PUN28_018801 [Cardiocondyla obscurior]|uniref:Uncharacterized protein n=1 Tax=Cardiocondyla obscurior TaxID=286306 RepID=A0AAW2EDH8_9HYME